MSLEGIGDIVRRVQAEAGLNAEPGSERARLLQAAQEFESMLMLQMLKEMRKAGSWDDEDGEKGYGAETLLETIDVELASHLSKAQGLGLGRQLLELLGSSIATKAGGSERHDPPYVPSGVGQVLPSGAGESLAIPEGKVTSGFGWRSDPFHGAARFHRGIDIRAAYGQDVPAAAAGRVVTAGTDGGYGESVVVEHVSGMRTRYAHLSTTTVTAGDVVTEGQVVGRAGHSGRATGTHLHFEVLGASGHPLDPEQFAGLKAGESVADLTLGRNPVLQETRR